MAYIGNPIYQSAFVTDTFSGDGSTTAFTMSVAPAGTSNVLVAVSGVLQDPATYGVVGTTLNFTSAPPSGTGNISCRYLGVPVTGVTTTAYRTVTEFTATASQTTFTPPSYTVGFINVYRNGVLLGSADYTATNGTTVVLATGATLGDLVTVESFQVSSVVNAIQNTAGSVSGTNIATGAVTPAKLSTGGPYWNTSSQVGIGTTSPSTYNGLLNVKSTDTSVLGYFGGTTYASRHGANSSFATIEGVDAATGVSSYQPLQVGGSILSMATGGTERMRIDTSGRVTMPYQPAFRAVFSGSYNVGANIELVPATAVTNIGSHYSTSTGRFTAPIAGFYHFAFNIRVINVTYYSLTFRVNSGVTSYFESNGAGANSNNQGYAINIYLNAGDYVSIYSGTQGGISSDSYAGFSGFLVG